MLIDGLIARAERCMELQALMDADPSAADYGEWVTELAQKSLNRREERHVAVVRTVRRVQKKIAMFEQLPDNSVKRAQIPALRAKVSALTVSDDLLTKEDVIDG